MQTQNTLLTDNETLIARDADMEDNAYYMMERSQYTDAYPILSTVYYRLKQAETDNSVDYSAVHSVTSASSNLAAISCFPNPVADVVTVQGSAIELTTLQLFDQQGKPYHVNMERNMESSSVTITLQLSELPAGTYYLKTSTQTRLLVKL